LILDRGTLKRFQRLFFISYARNQDGKLQNSIKYLAEERVFPILLAYCVKLVAGARIGKPGGWSHLSFQIRMRSLNLLR